MKREGLLLTGISGLVEGATFPLTYQQSAVLGRSSTCDISFRKLPRYLALPSELRHEDKTFLSISRRHVRITLSNSACIELENLGRHGSFLDGAAFTKTTITDIRERTHDLRVGKRELLRLSWGEFEEEAPVSINLGKASSPKRKSGSSHKSPRAEDD